MNLTQELLNFKKIYKQMVQQKGINTVVKKVQASGTWDSQYGILYKFDYEMEDGVALQANHKTPGAHFEVGEEVSYIIKRTGDFGNSGNVNKPEETIGEHYTNKKNEPKHDNKGGSMPPTYEKVNDTQTQIIRQSSLTRAVEVLSHNKADFDKEEVLILADYFIEFVLTGKR